MITALKVKYNDTIIFRAVIHFPHGVIAAICHADPPGIISPIFGWGIIAWFVVYEINEDRHIKDQAWKDLLGAMCGYFAFVLAKTVFHPVFWSWLINL